MAEVVDAIIADLQVRYQQYVDGFDKATAANARFTKSVPKIGAMGGFTQAEAQQYADRHKKVANDTATESENSGKRRAKAAKTASDAEKAEAKAAADAVKKAAKEKADAEKAAAKLAAEGVKSAEKEKQAAAKATAKEQAVAKKEAEARAVAERIAAEAAIAAAEREAAARVRLAEVVSRGVANRRLPQATNSRIGATVPREATGQRSIPSSVLNGAAVEEVAAEKEINHLLVEQAELQTRLTFARGTDRDIIRDQIAELRLINQLQKAGLDDAAIAIRLEERALLVERERAVTARGQTAKSAEQFARGAGFYAATGGPGAVAGIVAVGVASGILEATKAGLAYSETLKSVSEQLGITTKSLQVLQTAGQSVGVTTEQLRESLGQLSSNIGKAQEGAKEQGKLFGKDGLALDLGNAKTGYKNLGDLLPTIADRLSKITDQTRRNAIETAIGGEQFRKLDPILKQGSAGLSQLSGELERTGAILSAESINRAAKVARDLKVLGDQLERELASTISQNAAAIENLATALLKAASGALQFIDKIQRLRALSGLYSPDAASRDSSRASLNSSPEGRQTLLERNSADLRALRRGARDPNAAVIRVDRDAGADLPTTQRAARLRPTAMNFLGQRRRSTRRCNRSRWKG